jgi:hypothetical protein
VFCSSRPAACLRYRNLATSITYDTNGRGISKGRNSLRELPPSPTYAPAGGYFNGSELMLQCLYVRYILLCHSLRASRSLRKNQQDNIFSISNYIQSIKKNVVMLLLSIFLLHAEMQEKNIEHTFTRLK